MKTRDTDAIAALIAQHTTITHRTECSVDIQYKLLDGKGSIDALADYIAADATCDCVPTDYAPNHELWCQSRKFDRDAFLDKCYGEPAARSQ